MIIIISSMCVISINTIINIRFISFTIVNIIIILMISIRISIINHH